MFMKQRERTVGLTLAVLFLFLVLQTIRTMFGGSACNTFGPFGIAIPSLVLIGIGGTALIGVFVWISLFADRRNFIWGLLFLSGGASNLYERVIFGCTLDYFHPFIWFPVFNLADVFLTMAVLALIWENKGEHFR